MKIEPEVNQATRAELERLELLLMDPAVRRDRERVGALLTSDFVEFGSSGRVWTRDAMLEQLATETTCTPAHVDNFAFRLLGSDVVLVTYRTLRMDASGEQSVTLRSSIWIRESKGWRICFHQGTRAS
ncbi:MAG: nuclear transport factor 2 family protein [Terracidiphilus sp.]